MVMNVGIRSQKQKIHKFRMPVISPKFLIEYYKYFPDFIIIIMN